MAEAKAVLSDKEFRKFFEKVRTELSHSKNKIAAAYGIFGFKDIMNHFQQEKGSKQSWKPLKYRKGKPLQDSGYLRQSIISTNYQSIDDHSIRVFANADYSGYHNEGTPRIPKREFMWLSDKAMDNMVKMIMDQAVK